MFEPIRGGTRGGQAEFKWSDVSADKDRENYLGHSINAPTGRWQKSKDVHWYNREKKQEEHERLAEIQRIKDLEADALAVALFVLSSIIPCFLILKKNSVEASNQRRNLPSARLRLQP
ncbi:hypothetical protein L208DRAFT_1301953 [Tricholoma matsutake]|nr:hypothetical protein L208DRAFT_1301953 [Tricholoma matsutake 945]